ncbi:prostaglandin E synthase-like [Neocloeon triangulifer]|uniref:prostaglandin E synthase-like n=1 Tax=Neocloeon triangulifer TaxID=2078957 RepID=UPI00286F9396|nr:prostaglandin E synthase-like [Neocloeon triangulifer]
MSEAFDLSNNNPLLSLYARNASILVFKMFGVAALTGKIRHSKKKFANIEDAKAIKGAQVDTADEDVERVRRAHLNDLENIPPFLCISFLYILTDPEPKLARNLFLGFTAARICHTLVYAVKPVRQPARGLCYGVGLAITCYMATKVIKHFW